MNIAIETAVRCCLTWLGIVILRALAFCFIIARCRAYEPEAEGGER